MKKILCVMLLGFICYAGLFGAKNDFYEGEYLVDYMYVNSPEGLRIRNAASLSANKIGAFYDRMKVKPVEIGPEVTIDGIKSNWVRVVMPVETIKTGRIVTGWVFGGYLTKTLKPFSTENWTDADLLRYLSRFAWAGSARQVYSFSKDGKYSMGLLESSYGEDGIFRCSMKNKTVTISATCGDDQGDFGTATSTLKILSITEDSIVMEGKAGKFTFTPSFFTNYYFYPSFNSDDIKVNFDYEPENLLNALLYDFSSVYIINLLVENELKENSLYKFRIMGVALLGDENYMEDFRLYWSRAEY